MSSLGARSVDTAIVSCTRSSASRIILRESALECVSGPLVVAVSGGADSTCLLDVLVAEVPSASTRLIVGHVDHQLRPESAADADHVRGLATYYGLPCVVIDADVPEVMRAEGRGTEEAARVARYRALRCLVDREGASAVLTGHTRDDSAETVLMHLLRGSGSSGLGGIADCEVLGAAALGEDSAVCRDSRLRVVRPLIEVGRADTVAYCQARGLSWRDDASNSDPQFLRNRVRKHLLPVLRTYNPSIDGALDRLATVMHDEDRLLDEFAGEQHDAIVRRDHGRAAVDLDRWRCLHVALQRRLVRLIATDSGHTEIGFAAVERALAVSRDDGPPRAELGGHLIVMRAGGTLIFDTMASTAHEGA